MFEDDDPGSSILPTTRRRSGDPLARMSASESPDPTPVKADRLDSPQAVHLFKRLRGHYRREIERQSENRFQMGRDADYYDGDQWTDTEKAELEARGQPPLAFNVIATTINWLLGTEKRGRTDYRILPRMENGAQGAERKTALMKYLSDANRTEFSMSRAFADAVTVGVGWIESGVQSEDEGEPVYDRYESWRNIIYDSTATELDLSDARYIFRSRWVDYDVAASFYKDRIKLLERARRKSNEFYRDLDGTGDEQMDAPEEEIAQSGYGHYGSDLDAMLRDRLRLTEAWFRLPAKDQYMQGGQFSGEVYDGRSPGHRAEFTSGRAGIVNKTRMRTYVAVMCDVGLLFLSKSPYRHNRLPFTPVWGNRKGRNNLPYGIVRNMRDPQSDINKRAAKALQILSSNKTIMDEGAVDDLDEYAREASRPDAVIVKRQGKELRLDVDRDLAAGHIDLMSRSISMIQQQSGVTDESLGRTTNATSGKAIIARQDQGALATANLFDNLRYARQEHGSKMLSLMEQYFTEEKRFRITDRRGRAEYVNINDGLPENDIARSKADFIISEDDWAATMRQAQVEQFMALITEFGKTSPQIVMAVLDLLVEVMDIPQREELVKRIRQVTGMEDPDADPNAPDPETLARKQAAQEQADMQKRLAMAELAEREATAAERMARAQKAGADLSKSLAQVKQIVAATAGQNVETQVRALEAAATIISAAQLAGVADAVLTEAGYVAEPNAMGSPVPAVRPAPMAPPPMPAQPVPQPGMPPAPDPNQGAM